MEYRRMTGGESLYLMMVVAGFVVFAATVLYADKSSNRRSGQ
jgi:hypothetical protein